MSRAIDALIAYRLLKLLVVPFKKTKAYQMGIIDEKGKVLIKSKDIKTAFKTSNERLAADPKALGFSTTPTLAI